VGQTATFSVQVTGTSPTYQWSANGTAIPGATSASYTTPAAKTTDNSTQFTVAVSNSAGNVGSSPATLTVSSGTVQLTANPSSLSFGNTTIGTPNTLNVAVTNSGNSAVSISNTIFGGSGNFTASGVNGTPLNPGQTANLSVTFTPLATTPVTGSVSITSNAPTVKINLSGAGVQPTVTSITVNPANQTVAVGAQVQFTAVDNFGNDVTSSVTWSSSDPSIVSISASGLATGMTNGTATIAASK
jgi:plastocyanin